MALALNDIAIRRGQTMAQLALNWVLRSSSVTSAIIGASSVAQLEQNVAALEAPPLTSEDLGAIDRAVAPLRRS
jgi:L-glyceraldehyde 3-phosphate reductase